MAFAASYSLLLLLVVALTFSSAGVRPSPKMSNFMSQAARSIIKKTATDYLRDRAQQGVKDLSGRHNNNGDDHQLGSSAADSFGAFIFDLSLGASAPQTLSLVMDITSELVWAQCGEPVLMPPPETATFLPQHSDSFALIGCADQSCQSRIPGDACAEPADACRYVEEFHGRGDTSGYLATETFNFGTTPVPNLVFGCSDKVTLPDLDGASGFVGFSRGPLSLVSQLQISRFSYFIALPDDPDNGKSFVSWSWGDDADTNSAPAKGSHRSTPLLAATANQNPYLYYVKLTGVEVDGQLLKAIPAGTFDIQADGSGGVFLSTTTPVTYLDQAAYYVLKRELARRIQLQGVAPVSLNLDPLCFPTQNFANAKVPRVALVFHGADAVMELNVENYFFALASGQTCLTILPSTGGSVLGSLLQTGRTMTYDIHSDGGGMLTFETAAGAAPAQVSLMIRATLLLVWVLLF